MHWLYAYLLQGVFPGCEIKDIGRIQDQELGIIDAKSTITWKATKGTWTPENKRVSSPLSTFFLLIFILPLEQGPKLIPPFLLSLKNI